MQLNDYFQKIYCINLDRRPDRWTRCQQIFTELGLTVDRVSAVDSNDITVPEKSKITAGEIACSRSHANVLRDIVANGINRALVLEDDIEFRPGWHAQFDMALGNMPKWDMLYLGCNHVTKPLPFQGNVVKVTKGYTTSSYAVTKEFASVVLSDVERFNMQIDVVYSHKHRTHQCFAIKPSICYQRADHSDIQGGYTDYSEFFT